MIVVTIVVAVVAVAVVAVLLARQRASRARLELLAGELQQARSALARSEDDISQLQASLAERIAEEPPAADPDDDLGKGSEDATTVGSGNAAGVLEALWALTELDQTRSRRLAEALSTAAPTGPAPDGLLAGLQDEVSRLREETGTPGTLRVALDAEPAPGDAELLLRSVQVLLAVLSRHSQAYDLYVHRWDQRLLGVIVCEGFEGPDSVADETSEVLAALAPVEGRIELDRDAEGRLRARLSIPAS